MQNVSGVVVVADVMVIELGVAVVLLAKYITSPSVDSDNVDVIELLEAADWVA